MILDEALKIAYRLQSKLMESCEITHIAGSCRRLKTEVKDIEICCLPKIEVSFYTENATELFPQVVGPVSRPCKEFTAAVLQLGKPLNGSPSGRYMKILLAEGINLDLFIPQDFDYYRQLAIRTGPADYSYAKLAVGWRKLGWCGTADGLRKMTDCTERRSCDGKSTWYCTNPDPELPPVWKSEREFFDWLKVPWAEPCNR